MFDRLLIRGKMGVSALLPYPKVVSIVKRSLLSGYEVLVLGY